MAKKRATTSLFRKRILCSITTSTLVFSMLPAFSFPALAASADPLPHLLKAGSVPVNSNRSTKTEPFPQGTGGSDYFRIPALTCLENGDLLAVADARYNALGADGAAPDGGGLDTIASVSADGGKNWNYSFPIYFPDSSLNAGTKATTIIDPGILINQIPARTAAERITNIMWATLKTDMLLYAISQTTPRQNTAWTNGSTFMKHRQTVPEKN